MCAQSKPLAGSLKCAPRNGSRSAFTPAPHPLGPTKRALGEKPPEIPQLHKAFLSRQPQAPLPHPPSTRWFPRILRWNFPPIIMCFQQSECLSDTYFGSNNYHFRLAWQTLLAVNPVSILPFSTFLAATKGRLSLKMPGLGIKESPLEQQDLLWIGPGPPLSDCSVDAMAGGRAATVSIKLRPYSEARTSGHRGHCGQLTFGDLPVSATCNHKTPRSQPWEPLLRSGHSWNIIPSSFFVTDARIGGSCAD